MHETIHACIFYIGAKYIYKKKIHLCSEINMMGICFGKMFWKLKNLCRRSTALSKYVWFFKREAYVYKVVGYKIKEVKRTF